ncbi:MAG: rhomboid family intramembrane serine protease, partial [Nitriliruptor sp.]
MQNTRSYPLSLLFLVTCVSVFAVAQLTDPEHVRFLALDSASFPERWYTVVTTGFVHVEWNHIIVNMLLLLWVGTWVERLIGSRRFAVVVFTAILAGSLSILVRDTAGIGFSAAA